MTNTSSKLQSAGFTLVELSVVLFVVALLLGGMMTTMSTQIEQQRIKDTQRILDEAKDALMGFAAANGRLPCPAAPGTTGVENPLGGGTCTHPWNGFLPAVTLSMNQTDASGYALDSWGNRIAYAVTTATSNSFTTANGLKSDWVGGIYPDLRVCNTAIGISGSGTSADCATGATLSNSAVAVILSYGKNLQQSPQHTNEAANTANNRTFVSATPIPNDLPTHNGFDDLVTWLSANTLFNRMIAAGKLP